MKATLEARMGEMAALLDDVAEALVHFPNEIEIVDDAQDAEGRKAKGQVRINASAWPTIQEIDRVLANWRALSSLKPNADGRPPAV